jgi:hypothetical protein
MENKKKILIGIENEFEGRSLAWVFDHPGCFAYGSSETEALVRVPLALVAYKSWLEGYTEDSWLGDLGDFDIRLSEVVKCYSINAQFEPTNAPDAFNEVNAWFHYDWRTLTAEEITRGLLILEWAHRDLFELTAGLSPEKLTEQRPGEHWSITGILDHVASAELYYLDRLNLTSHRYPDLTGTPWQKLDFTLQENQTLLPDLAGNNTVTGKEGEFWSARKILRRACWHALDHCQHIHRLITTPA